MATLFPMRARRDDPQNGYMVVQSMVEFLRDAFDKYTGSIARGAATVLNGNTTVAVTIPTSVGGSYSVSLTATADPAGRYWVSGKSASGFTINLQTAAPVAGIPFDWIVKGA